MKNKPVQEVSYEKILRLMAEGAGDTIIHKDGIDIITDSVTYTCTHVLSDCPAAPLDTRHSTDWETAINSGI